MPRRITKLNSLNGVAKGSTATLDCPVDRRYHQIVLEYKHAGVLADKATVLAHIKAIRIRVNGILQREYRGMRVLLDAINAANGVVFKPGLIPIYFSEPWRRNAISEDELAWPMEGNASTFQIEVDIDGAAVTPELKAFAVTDNARRANGSLLPFTGIIKVLPTVVTVSAAGKVAITTLPKTNTYMRLHCEEGADGDITEVDISIDQLTVYQQTRAQNEWWVDQQGMVPQSGFFPIAFDATQRINDGLPMVRADGMGVSEFLCEFVLGAPNNFVIHAELLGNPNI